MRLTKIYGSVIGYLILLAMNVHAQNTLPDLTINTDNGYNIISWQNPYKSGLKAIIVERSSDSTFNFSTIGIIKDFNHTIQSFVDVTPLAGANWYRVNVVFQSDVEWRSNTVKIVLDSAAISNRKQVVSIETLQDKVNEKLNNSQVSEKKEIVKEVVKQIEIPKSIYIFTNPFSGNINIELPDTREYNYFITFYTQHDKKVFEIPRIHEDEIILDKRNFQNTGTYKFIILRDNKEFEKGLITLF
jgi:hypothetical protein